jgi:phosphate transport system substrate-binding protein
MGIEQHAERDVDVARRPGGLPHKLTIAVAAIALACTAALSAQTLNGAGATFPYPIYAKWFQAFSEQHPGTQVQYEPVGSTEGIRLLKEKKVDFAATDVPLSDSELAQLPYKAVWHLPALAGAVVPVYHLEGVARDLRFTPEVLAGIFLGKITRWNDAAIRAANSHLALPDAEIVVVHRSDGSGTTFVFTEYLSKVSPDWNGRVGSGTRVKWPIGSEAQGNEGVAKLVGETPNSIGYTEFIYALQNRLSFGAVQNAEGHFVTARVDSITAAASTVSARDGDLRISMTNCRGREAYPIASFTYLLIPADAVKPGLRELLNYAFSSGQKQAQGLGYVPVPDAILQAERNLIERTEGTQK